MTSERVRRAQRKYGMFKGEPLFLEETASEDDLDYVPYEYKKVPVNFGFELEQKPADIGVPQHRILNRESFQHYGLTWDYDLSGPYEAQLPAGTRGSMRYPGREVHQFYRLLAQQGNFWNWKGEFSGNGCGCHMHFSARTEIESPYRLQENPYEAWTVLYNTLVEVVPFLKPLFAWGKEGIFSHRESIRSWASDRRLRLSVSSVRNKLDNPTGFGEDKHNSVAFHPASGEPEERDGLGSLFSTRSRFVTPQVGVAAKPITVEMRMNEAHPSATYLSGILLNRIVRKCIERGYRSPKLEVSNAAKFRGTSLDRDELLENMTDLSSKSYDWISRGRFSSLYDLYDSHIKDIRFQENRGIPLLDEQYDSYMDLFKAILRKYIPTYPPLARVALFYYDEGDPWSGMNQTHFWEIFAPLNEFPGWDGI